jgi:hypothetical protein
MPGLDWLLRRGGAPGEAQQGPSPCLLGSPQRPAHAQLGQQDEAQHMVARPPLEGAAGEEVAHAYKQDTAGKPWPTSRTRPENLGQAFCQAQNWRRGGTCPRAAPGLPARTRAKYEQLLGEACYTSMPQVPLLLCCR